MDLENYLLEQKLKKDPSLLNFFNNFASNVFTVGFLNSIKDLIPELKIKEVVNRNRNLAAYTRSKTTIYVNRPVFYSLTRKGQVAILMHEFIHILQFKKVKEVKKLSEEIWSFVERNRNPESSVSEIVLGKKFIRAKFMNKNEVLPYLMNQTLRWEKMKDGSKEELEKILRASMVFNTSSDFWKEKLK